MKDKMMKFDPVFLSMIDQLSKAIEITPVEFIENVVTARIAREKAWADVYGGSIDFFEFLEYDGQMIKGNDLFDMVYTMERETVELKYCDELAAVPREVLTEQDIEIIKRRRPDWLKD